MKTRTIIAAAGLLFLVIAMPLSVAAKEETVTLAARGERGHFHAAMEII